MGVVFEVPLNAAQGLLEGVQGFVFHMTPIGATGALRSALAVWS